MDYSFKQKTVNTFERGFDSFLLFPDDTELQDIYNSASSIVVKKRMVKEARPGHSYLYKDYDLQFKEAMERIPVSVEILEIIKNKQVELLGEVNRLKSKIWENEGLVRASHQFIKDVEAEHAEALIKDNQQDIADIEANIDQREVDIKPLERRNIASQKGIDLLLDVGKIVNRMILYVENELSLLELRKAEKVYQEHLNNFVEHFKEFNAIARRFGRFDSFRFEKRAVLDAINKGGYK